APVRRYLARAWSARGSLLVTDAAPTLIYTLSLHDALPISGRKETVVAPLALELLDDRKAARGPHCGREHQQRDEQRRQRGGEPGDPREIPRCASRGTCRGILP